jgi:hypothetical protein
MADGPAGGALTDAAVEPAVLADYLLGRLPERSRRELEARYLEDEQLYDEVVAAAEALLEDYVRGALPAAERRHVEERLLPLPWWRERLEVARVLTLVAERSTPAPQAEARAQVVSPAAATRAARIAARLRWVGATAAAVLIALAGAWMAMPPRAVPPAAGGGAAAAPRDPAPLPTPESRSADDAAAPLPLLRLGGVSYRDDGALPQIAVPPRTPAVRLVVVLGAAPDRPYRAELRDVEGQVLAAENGLRAVGRAGSLSVTVSWPVPLLPPGDYTVAILPEGSAPGEEPVVEHAFRVRAR